MSRINTNDVRDFAAQLPPDRREWMEAVASELDAVRTERNMLRRSVPELAPGFIVIPIQPDPALLVSMAIRSDHALGVPDYYDQKILRDIGGPTHKMMFDSAIRSMKQIHEEVVGAGYYSEARRNTYLEIAKKCDSEIVHTA